MEPWAEYDTEVADGADENIRIGVASAGSPYNWDSDKRLEHLDAEGIGAEVLFPNTVPPFYPSGPITAPRPPTPEDYRYRWAGVQAHNRWMVDFCAQAPGRRAGLAQVFLGDLDDAIAEARVGQGRRPRRRAHPVRPHEQPREPVRAPPRPVLGRVRRDRHPRAPSRDRRSGPPETPETRPGGGRDRRPRDAPVLPPRPRAPHVRRACSSATPTCSSCSPRRAAPGSPRSSRSSTARSSSARSRARPPTRSTTVRPSDSAMLAVGVLRPQLPRRRLADGQPPTSTARHDVGVDTLMWGSDYPHHEGSFPHTKLALRLLFSDLPEDEVRQMTSAQRRRGLRLRSRRAPDDRRPHRPHGRGGRRAGHARRAAPTPACRSRSASSSCAPRWPRPADPQFGGTHRDRQSPWPSSRRSTAGASLGIAPTTIRLELHLRMTTCRRHVVAAVDGLPTRPRHRGQLPVVRDWS